MHDWSDYDLSDYEDYYWEEIAPAMAEAGLNPNEPPTYRWLYDNGFSGFLKAVSRHLNITFKDFAEEEMGISRTTDRLHALDIEHPRTRELVYRWGERHLLERKGHVPGTVENCLRYLDKVAEEMRAQYRHDDLLEVGSEETPRPESYEMFVDVFDALDSKYSNNYVKNIYSGSKRWYDYLVRRRNPVDYNPVEGVSEDFNWETKQTDPLAISPRQVRALVEAAETLKEKTLVVLFCAAGLRREEVARVHRSMVVFDPEDVDTPLIEFDRRKNADSRTDGPSTVNLVYGADILRERIEELEDDLGDGWSGYLLPSPNRNRDHYHPDGVGKMLRRLIDEAARETDVDMTLQDGSSPSPQNCRRFWYNQYSKGVDIILSVANTIANEQGSADAQVVIHNYMSRQRRLKILRDHMETELSKAFADTEIGADRSPDPPEEPALVDDLDVSPDAADDVVTPVDRFLQEKAADGTGWISNRAEALEDDVWGRTSPKGTAKTAVVGVALAAANFLLFGLPAL